MTNHMTVVRIVFLLMALGFWADLSFSQETEPAAPEKVSPKAAEEKPTQETVPVPETKPEVSSAISPDDNPGLQYLDRATEKKLEATSIDDLSEVIGLCERANREGLSGDYLDFCKSLLAATRMQRGLFAAQALVRIPIRQLPQEWKTVRDRALADLEAAVQMVRDHARAYLMIAQLLTMRGPGEKEPDDKKVIATLELAIEKATDDKETLDDALLMRALLEEDLVKREAAFEKALTLSPDVPELLLAQALNFQEQQKYDEALPVLKKLMELAPENTGILHIVFDIRKKQKKYGEAMKVLDLLLKDHPDAPNLLFEKAHLLAIEKKFDQALTILDALRAKNPKSLEVLYLRGIINKSLKKYEEAIADTEEAISIQPDMVDLKILKADILAAQDKLDEAAAMLETLITEAGPDSPKTADLQFQLGAVLTAQKKSRQAAELLQKALEKKPEDPFGLRMYANALLSSGRHSEAIRAFEKILEKDPEDEMVLNNLSWLLSTSPIDNIRDGKRSLELAEKACKVSEYKKAYILSTLAAAYAEQGDFDKAREWSQKAVDLGKEEGEERLDELKKELESYQNNRPWREMIEEKE